MGYGLRITGSALADAEEYAHFLRYERRNPEAAERWFRGLVKTVFSLERFPDRCAVIPEALEFDRELRHEFYRSHRIVFSVDREEKVVTILRVYHSSRKRLKPGDLLRRDD